VPIPEQKISAISSEESTIETAAKISSEPVQLGDICTKPTTEPKDVKSYEICTEVPPPAEPLPVGTTAEQKAVPQSVSLFLEIKEPKQQTDSETSPLVCKSPVQEAAPPVATQIDKSAPIEAKLETLASAAQDATQPAALISVDSSQDIAVTSPVASQASEDTAKHVIEFAPDVTQPLTIDPGERHADMLLAASEISTVSPVPIQVAESVLQAESVLGAAVIVSDQAIASTVTAVQSTDVASTLQTPTEPVQLNGSACDVERIATVIPGLPEKTDAPPKASKVPASDLVTTKDIPSEAPVTEEKILTSSTVLFLETSSMEKLPEQIARIETEAKPREQIAETETAKTKPVEQIAKTLETAEAKPSEQITKTEATQEKSAEQATKAETTKAEVVKQAETVAQTEITTAMSINQGQKAAIARLPSEILQQSPPAEEPIEAKPPNVPSTPTVTEASPPISPSMESVQEMEENAKSLKKSDSVDGADGESADKKAAKKTVKKVTKKPKTKPDETTPSVVTEVAAADGSQSKAKKTTKTARKTSTKTLETDTSVPETPPPPMPAGAVGVDAPVPPKRKTKGSTNAKGTGKKSEAEE